MPTPRAATPAHTPMALPRSTGSVKTLVMIDNVAGMMNAPPIPMNARVAMRTWVDPERADAREPIPNTANPKLSVLCRPNRSPSDPAVSRSPANTRV